MIVHRLRIIAMASLALVSAAQAQDLMDTLPRDASGKPLVVSQIMVLFKARVEPRPRAPVSEAIVKRLSKAAGVELRPGRLLPEEDWQLVQLPTAVTEDESEVIANKLKGLPIVLDAWPNEPTQIISPPGKPQYLKFLDEEPDKSRFMRWSTFNVPNVEEVIVKFKGSDGGPATELASRTLVADIGRLGGVTLVSVSETLHPSAKDQKFKLPRRMTQNEADTICTRIRRHPKVEYCDPNGVAYAMATATDPELGRQWGLLSNTYGGARVDQAWNTTTGTNTVIAVLDTGRLAHTELTGRYLPGYDFITDPRRSGDGDARDADPEDRAIRGRVLQSRIT